MTSITKRAESDEQKTVLTLVPGSPDERDVGDKPVSEPERLLFGSDGSSELSASGQADQGECDGHDGSFASSDSSDPEVVDSGDSLGGISERGHSDVVPADESDDSDGNSVPDSDAPDAQLRTEERERRDGEHEAGGGLGGDKLQEGQSHRSDLRRGVLVPPAEPERLGKLKPSGAVQWKEYDPDSLLFVKATAKNVLRYYSLVIKDLRRLIHKAQVPVTPSQVFDILEQDRGWLIVGFDKDTKKYLGFVVVSQEPPDQFTGNRAFLIWLAFCKHPGVAKILFDELEKMASDLGYTEIIMRSIRPGWDKLAEAYGFTPKERLYSKPLDNQSWPQT